jgi:carbamoylphosphate synthase large subunit
MKKLMILGGSRYIIPVIKKAHELGIYVITCDYLPNNIAHKFSDEYVNVSIVEKEKVLDVARQMKIDGIISFACDPGVVSAAYVAEKMGLPFQCSYSSAKILQDKGLFRQFLIDNGFNSPTAKKYYDIDDPLNDIDYFNWPVIIKPTDSAGSKGITKINNPSEIKSAARNALLNSIESSFIIEDYITFEGYHSTSDVFVLNGIICFITFSDHYFDLKARNHFIPAYSVWPSTMKVINQKILTDEIQRLFYLLNVNTGLFNIETCVSDKGVPYIMEVSPRGGGCKIAELQELAFKQPFIENEIRKAVGLNLLEINQSDCDGFWCETVLHINSDSEKSFFGIELNDDIVDKVNVLDLSVKNGDTVYPFTGANMSIGDMFLKFETRDEINYFINNFSKFVNIELK